MAIKTIDDTNLTAIADAIRAKGVEGTFKPSEMATAIASIQGGGGGVEIDRGLSNGFVGIGWNDAQFERNSVKCKNITTLYQMFYKNTAIVAPKLSIACASPKEAGLPSNSPWGPSGISMFDGCTALEDVSGIKLSGTYIKDCYKMFSGAKKLVEIPLDWVPEGSFKISPAYDSAARSPAKNGKCFQDCYRLRHINNFFQYVEDCEANPGNDYLVTYYTFDDCPALEEVIDFPSFSPKYTWSTSPFAYIITRPHNLRRFTFRPGGTLRRSGSTAFTFNLSNYCGYFNNYDFTNGEYMYSNVVPNAKLINSDETYAQYKNHPDAVTLLPEYSFFGHNSAKELIDSLPTIQNTGSGTVTLMLKGACGSKTDQGAIDTLTDAEIAVATDKGWTVTLS